jgi:hypothetical protein
MGRRVTIVGAAVAVAMAMGVAGVAWADTLCHLSGGTAIASINVSPQDDVTTDWQQGLNCSSGVSDPQVCWYCLGVILYRWDPSSGTWAWVSSGGVKGSVNCNRSAGREVGPNDWGIRPAGHYDFRTIIYQGGRCSLLIAWSDHQFTVP